MNTNELCTSDERQKGYSSHIIGYGVLLYKNSSPYMQFATEADMHEYLNKEVEKDENETKS